MSIAQPPEATSSATEPAAPQRVLALAERMRPGTVLDPRCAVYRAYRFGAAPDLELLGRALSMVVERQDAAHTVPVTEGGELRVARREPAPVRVRVRDLPPERSRAAITEAGSAAHDLDEGPLLRATWLRDRRDGGGVLVLSMHHWIGDGGALEALHHEVTELYAALAHGAAMPPRPEPYHRPDPSGRELAAESGLAWWRAELRGARRAGLPVTGQGRTPGGATALTSTTLPAHLNSALLSLAGRHNASPYMVLLAALGGQFEGARTRAPGSAAPDTAGPGTAGSEDTATGEADLTVFTTHDARSAATRRTLGFYAEPLPLRLRLGRAEPFGAAVAQARRTVLGALGHGDVPLLELLANTPRLAVALLRGQQPATLVQYLAPADLRLGELRGRALPTFEASIGGESHHAALPIDLDITIERCRDEHGVDTHHLAALYDPGMFGHVDVTAALLNAQETLARAAADPDAPLGGAGSTASSVL